MRRFLPVIAVGAGLAALHVLWLARFRWGFFVDWDEAGYLATALQFHDALPDGPGALADAQRASAAQPPLVPASAIPLLAVFGRDVDAGQVTNALWSIVLVVATYGLASRVAPHRWALLAALCVGTAPVVADYSRMFHFAVPAAALMACALWALAHADGLIRTRWVIAAGALLALMTTARTMTLAYVPAVVAGAGLALVLAPGERRLRARNLGVLALTTAGVAALWWIPSWDNVWPYLTGTGYGAEAAAYGQGHSVLSADFWTSDLERTLNELQVPLAVALVACGVAALGRVRAGLRRPEVVLLVVVAAGGWLALTTTRNQGTAFDLPWLPALVVLAVGGAAHVRRRELRLGLAAALVAVCAWNLVATNGVDESLSRPRLAGSQVLVNGLGFFHGKSVFHGYARTAPPQPLPALHRRWSELHEGIARLAAARVPSPAIGVATGDYFITETRLRLAAVLRLRRALGYGLVRGPGDLAPWNVLVTAEAPPRPGYRVDRAAVEEAARAAGFERARTFTAPDGRDVVVWVRT